MKKIIKNLSVFLALAIMLPVCMFTLSACKDKEPDKNNPNTPDEVVDENPNSPIRSGIYKYAEEPTLANMFFLDDGSEACELFKTRDINGVRGVLSSAEGEEKYGFQKFVETITKQDNLQKCVEFNTKNEVSTYLISDGFYTRIHQFTYLNHEFIFTNSDPTAPFISYNEETKTVSLFYKFFIKNEEGKDVFSHVYVKVAMEFECDSLDMMIASKSMTEFAYKADSIKVVDANGTTLDASKYSEELIKMFNLEAETTTAMEDVVGLISSFKVNVDNKLLTVLIKDTQDEFKFSFNSVSNNVMAIGNISIAVSSSITDIENTSEIELTIALNDSVKLQFTISKVQAETPEQTPETPENVAENQD